MSHFFLSFDPLAKNINALCIRINLFLLFEPENFFDESGKFFTKMGKMGNFPSKLGKMGNFPPKMGKLGNFPFSHFWWEKFTHQAVFPLSNSYNFMQ